MVEEIKTHEIIKKYRLDENIVDLTLDVAFKKALSMKSNRWYLAFLISYCTKLDIEYILKHLEFKTDYIAGKDVGKKTGNGDLVVEIENKVINLEMNREVTESLIRKNKWYVDTLNSNNVEKNERINQKFIIQINISTKERIPQTNTLVYEIVRMDRNLLIEDVYNNEIIYDINLEYLKNELYNKHKIKKEEKRLVIFIEKNKDKLKELYKGDLNMKDTVENVGKIGYLEDKRFAIEYDREALNKQIYKEGLEDARKEGIEEGEKTASIAIIKKLLKTNISIESISKITELPIEEIQEIQKSILKDKIYNIEYDKEALEKQIYKEGLEDARKEGEKNASINIAKQMLKNHISLSEIEKYTNISIEELNKIDY